MGGLQLLHSLVTQLEIGFLPLQWILHSPNNTSYLRQILLFGLLVHHRIVEILTNWVQQFHLHVHQPISLPQSLHEKSSSMCRHMVLHQWTKPLFAKRKEWFPVCCTAHNTSWFPPTSKIPMHITYIHQHYNTNTAHIDSATPYLLIQLSKSSLILD